MANVNVIESARAPRVSAAFDPPGLREYTGVVVFLVAYGIGLSQATEQRGPVPPNEALLGPIATMVGLTAVVWLAMLVFRNYAVIRGTITGEYFSTYSGSLPPDWIERPARTFNNLMQVPTLFYVACAFMMILQRVDHVAVLLAWIYVLTRVAHASIYMIWNYVPARFATWVASWIALCVLWVRFLTA